MAQYCPDCGASVASGDVYCSECGAALPESPPRQEYPPVREESPPPHQSTVSDPGDEAFGPSSATQSSGVGVGERVEPPKWPLVAIAICWVAFVVTWSGTEAVEEGAGSLMGIAVLAVAISLPLLYYDAKEAAAAGALEVEYPIAVPVVVLLLWLRTVPAYVLYRWY